MLNRKILFIKATPYGSGYYRMEQAQKELKRIGYNTDVVMFNDVDPESLIAYKDKFDLKTVKNITTKVNLKTFHTVIFQMVWHEALITVIQKLKNLGIRTAMEVDDDYTCLPANNPSFYSFHPRAKVVQKEEGRYIQLQQRKYKLVGGRGGRPKYVVDRRVDTKVNFTLDNMYKAAQTVDILQVSTPELAQSYRGLNDSIVVLENCIENHLYDIVPKINNKIPVVGWFGTKTHEDDLRLVDGCIPENCKLLIAGFPDVQGKMFKYHENIEFIPPYQLAELPKIVKSCDIGIVPLVDNKFNSGKSDLKGVEFGAGGICVVASDVAPYRRWINNGVNGFLASKTKHWIRYLQQLVDSKELREQLGKQAKQDAIKRDIKNNIQKWIEVYYGK